MENTDRAKTVQEPCSHGLQNKKAMKSFDFTAFSGAMEGTRTPGLLIRSQSLYPAELPTHTFRSEHDIFYHPGTVLSTVFCNYLFIFLQSPSFSRYSVLLASVFPPFLRQRRTGQAGGAALKGPAARVLRAILSISRRSVR